MSASKSCGNKKTAGAMGCPPAVVFERSNAGYFDMFATFKASYFAELLLGRVYGASIGSGVTDLFECDVNFFERFFTKVRDAQQLLRRAAEQIAYSENPSLFEAIRCSNGQTDFCGAQFESFA